MRFQKQRFLHAPAQGIWGDCERTAIACMLDLDRDEVPHFADNFKNNDDVISKERAWLRGQELAPFSCAFGCELGELLACMAQNNPGLYYLLSGSSRTGVNHTVVALDGEIIWDPAINDSGITGPCDDGYYWIKLYVPLRLTCTRSATTSGSETTSGSSG